MVGTLCMYLSQFVKKYRQIIHSPFKYNGMVIHIQRTNISNMLGRQRQYLNYARYFWSNIQLIVVIFTLICNFQLKKFYIVDQCLMTGPCGIFFVFLKHVIRNSIAPEKGVLKNNIILYQHFLLCTLCPNTF